MANKADTRKVHIWLGTVTWGDDGTRYSNFHAATDTANTADAVSKMIAIASAEYPQEGNFFVSYLQYKGIGGA